MSLTRCSYEKSYLQRSPHLILLNPEYYDTDLRPALARWAVLWLTLKGLTIDAQVEPAVLAYLEGHRQTIAGLSDPCDVMLLNMCCDWVCCFLPHILQKIDRYLSVLQTIVN